MNKILISTRCCLSLLKSTWKLGLLAFVICSVTFVPALDSAYSKTVDTTVTPTFVGESDIDLTITGGELDNLFGFGTLDEELSAPGPTINIKNGQVVKIIFENIGEIPHTFRITEGNTTDSAVLFN